MIVLDFMIGDPRIEFIKRKLSALDNVHVFISGKGGVGKSIVSALLSLCLVERGFKVGLVDLDLTNPTLHIILGVNPKSISIIEEGGVKPIDVHGVKFFSPVFFTLDEPLPLRGSHVVEALRELLTIVNLSEVNTLLLDMPPGVKEEILEISRLPKVNNVIVASQDLLGIRSALRLAKFLKEEGIGRIMLIENLSTTGKPLLQPTLVEGVVHLGVLPYDPTLREALGDIKLLVKTNLYGATCNLVDRLMVGARL